MQTIKILEIGESVYYFSDRPSKGKVKSRTIKEDGTIDYYLIATHHNNKEYQGDRRNEIQVFITKEGFLEYITKLINEL